MWKIAVLPIVLTSLVCAQDIGIETNDALSNDDFSCLMSGPYQFILARVFNAQGNPDPIGVQNIATAIQQGMTAFSTFFPCRKCKASATDQVNSAIEFGSQNGLQYGGLFLVIEPRGWEGTTQADNVAFIGELIQSVSEAGALPVIYSSVSAWDVITGSDTEFANQVNYVQYYHFDGQASFSDYTLGNSFGGFPSPYMKTYQWGQSVCGHQNVMLQYNPNLGSASKRSYNPLAARKMRQ